MTFIKPKRIVALGLCILALGIGCSRLSLWSKDYNVLVITLDTTRADHLACYGYERVKTPNLDRLAKEGVLFSKAYTPVPITLPSHSTIFTGLDPLNHGVRYNSIFVLPDEALTLAEILSGEGYHTAAAVSSFVMDHRFGLSQGFDTYLDKMPSEFFNPRIKIREFAQVSADQVTDRAIKWLDARQAGKWFLWVHYFDPHFPYKPPEPYLSDYAENPYDGEIEFMDHQLGRLLERLRAEGVLDKTIVVVVGDHGEGLGEHNEDSHSYLIYNSTIHVPLIMRIPDYAFAGKVLDESVGTRDILPTLLDMLGLEHPGSLDGQSMLNLIQGRSDELFRMIYIETMAPRYQHGWSPMYGLIHEGYKYVDAPKPELYELDADEKELENLYDARRGLALKMDRMLEQYMQEQSRSLARGPSVKALDKEAKDMLLSLGYLANISDNVQANSDKDPKEYIVIVPWLMEGVGAYNMQDYAKAKELLGRVLNKDPQNRFALRQLALTHYWNKDYQSAIALYEQLIVLTSGYANLDAMNNAAQCYSKLGNQAQAIMLAEKVVELAPEESWTHNSLGIRHVVNNDLQAAEKQFQMAIDLDVYHADPHYNMGVVLARTERFEESLEEFEAAIMLMPSDPDYRKGLKDIYQKLGIEKSLPELKK